jgi:imidazole glycerol-phosphate synthase subunit HisH
MIQRTVGIIDYGVGNHASVVQAVKTLGYLATVSNDVDTLSKCDVLILPGVGSFTVAMTGLERFGFINFLRRWAYEAHPMIGICLGMQLLATTGTEGGITAGLNLLPGEVTRLENGVVHIGWNNLNLLSHDNFFHPFEDCDFYFNHSYVLNTKPDFVIATTRFSKTIPSIVRSGSVVGLQFHPEKSQKDGLALLGKTMEVLIA